MNLKEYIASPLRLWRLGQPPLPESCRTDLRMSNFTESRDTAGAVFTPCLVHMMSSETVWLKRWHGEAPKAHLDPKDFPTLRILRDQWTLVRDQIREFLERQTENGLSLPITYRNFDGEQFHVPLWQMLMHIPNHETHHRGELAAMFALMNVGASRGRGHPVLPGS